MNGKRDQARTSSLFRQLHVLLITLTLAFTFTLLVACSTQPNSVHTPKLLVSLAFTPQQMIIENGNDFVWSKVTILLNNKYSYTTEILPRGPSSLLLTEFHDPQGIALDPLNTTPHQLTVTVLEGFNGKPDRFIW